MPYSKLFFEKSVRSIRQAAVFATKAMHPAFFLSQKKGKVKKKGCFGETKKGKNSRSYRFQRRKNAIEAIETIDAIDTIDTIETIGTIATIATIENRS